MCDPDPYYRPKPSSIVGRRSVVPCYHLRVIRTLVALSAVLFAAGAACSSTPASRTPAGAPSSDTTSAPVASPAAPGCTAARPHAAGDFSETIESGGLTRTYILHVPAGYDGASAMPLVLSFHPYGTNAKFMSDYVKFDALADQKGFVVVTPDGTGQPQYWNVRKYQATADDVAFAKDLIAKIDASLCIDATRTYAAGYSNGGGMALRLACEMPERIAAIGVVAGTYLNCNANVPLIAFHGIADPVVAFEGADSAPAGGESFPPIRRSVSEWAKMNSCDGLPTISRPAADVELSTFHRCREGDGGVLLYTLLGGGHTWPGATDLPAASVGVTNHQIDATKAMWDFFAAHPRAR